ncbi:MAG: hypothetical protein WCB31_03035 [Nitrososphaeraceae archaeon]
MSQPDIDILGELEMSFMRKPNTAQNIHKGINLWTHSVFFYHHHQII